MHIGSAYWCCIFALHKWGAQVCNASVAHCTACCIAIDWCVPASIPLHCAMQQGLRHTRWPVACMGGNSQACLWQGWTPNARRPCPSAMAKKAVVLHSGKGAPKQGCTPGGSGLAWLPNVEAKTSEVGWACQVALAKGGQLCRVQLWVPSPPLDQTLGLLQPVARLPVWRLPKGPPHGRMLCLQETW